MVDIKYANAYSEVLEILKYVSIEDYNKIPENKIELFKTNANTDYNFIYNPNKTLEEQEVSKIVKGIIAILFRDYWATESQRNKIITKQNYDRVKLEEEKKSKYNTDNIFNNNNSNIQKEIEQHEETRMTIVQKEKWYQKVFNLIKGLFKKG